MWRLAAIPILVTIPISHARVWGDEGHRIICELAYREVAPATRWSPTSLVAVAVGDVAAGLYLPWALACCGHCCSSAANQLGCLAFERHERLGLSRGGMRCRERQKRQLLDGRPCAGPAESDDQGQ